MAAMKGKWAQGITPRNFVWVLKDRLAVCERPGRLRRQPPPRPPPGGDHLDPRAGLHPRRLAHRRRPQPAQLRRARRGLAPPARRAPTTTRSLFQQNLYTELRHLLGQRREAARAPGGGGRPRLRARGRLPAVGGPRAVRARRRSRSPSGSPAASSARWVAGWWRRPTSCGPRATATDPGPRAERATMATTHDDRIELRGLRLVGRVGVLDLERAAGPAARGRPRPDRRPRGRRGQRRPGRHGRLRRRVRHRGRRGRRRARRPARAPGRPRRRRRARRSTPASTRSTSTVRKLRPPVPADLATSGVHIVRPELTRGDRRRRPTRPRRRRPCGPSSASGPTWATACATSATRWPRSRDVGLVAVSPVYETDPVGGPADQDSFLNLVVELRTDRTPHELLGVCHRLEAAAERVRDERWGPRTLDVDVLWVDGVTRRRPRPGRAPSPHVGAPVRRGAPARPRPRRGRRRRARGGRGPRRSARAARRAVTPPPRPRPRAAARPRRVRIVGPGRAGHLAGARAHQRRVGRGARCSGGRDDVTPAPAEGVDLLVLATPDDAIAGRRPGRRPGRRHRGGPPGRLARPRGAGPAPAPGRRPPARVAARRPSSAPAAWSAGWFAVAGDPLADEVVRGARAGGRSRSPTTTGPTYHAAAVIASNHLVALLGQVERLAESVGVPFAAYLDLATDTLDNVAELGPGGVAHRARPPGATRPRCAATCGRCPPTSAAPTAA